MALQKTPKKLRNFPKYRKSPRNFTKMITLIKNTWCGGGAIGDTEPQVGSSPRPSSAEEYRINN